MGKTKLHSGHIEVAVAMLLDYRKYTIVPNVSWGLGLCHECDMLALSQDGYFTEIEIKISMSDLRHDFKKGHGHKSSIISRLVYAFPVEMLEKALPLIPTNCGIIVIQENYYIDSNKVRHHKGWVAEWYRRTKGDKSKKPTDKDVIKFMQLGCMRIWSLKSHNNKIK